VFVSECVSECVCLCVGCCGELRSFVGRYVCCDTRRSGVLLHELSLHGTGACLLRSCI